MTDEAIPVRLSHLLRQCAVGTIVRGKNFLMTVKDTSKWYGYDGPPPMSEIRYVDQVRASLGIDQRLCMPPVAILNDDGSIKGTWIPAVRFPKWMYCPHPQCGLLYRMPWKENHDDGKPRCEGAKNAQHPHRRELEQVPWVVVHEDGYMADVPWYSIAHSRKRDKPTSASAEPKQHARCYKKAGDRPFLRIKEEGFRRFVQCTLCHSKREFPKRTIYPLWEGQQPWIRQEPSRQDDGKSEHAWIIEINDVRLHNSCIRRALVIPPESRIESGTVVDRLYSNSDTQKKIERARPGLQRKSILKGTARDWRCSVDQIREAIDEIKKGYPLYGKEFSRGNLHEGEYSAFLKTIADLREDEDFVTEHYTEEWKSLANQHTGSVRKIVHVVDNLIAVRRLKEIAVFKGFSRLGSENIVPPDISGSSPWLPALSLRGEGVFFTFDESHLSRWQIQEGLVLRCERLNRRRLQHVSGRLDHDIEVSPRFVLLHTLAHALIRQFESQAGYPAASLRERIYCSSIDFDMAGVLIYVAVPDALGSLGGIVELARPQTFLRIMSAAINTVGWCSLDPVCGQHTGQGPGLLNLAACHACTLIPETSCAYRNTLLDRTFVKGDADNNIRSVLDFESKES